MKISGRIDACDTDLARDAAVPAHLPEHDARCISIDQAYREHWQGLCRYLRAMFGSGPPEPEEVAQSAFERLAGLEDLSGIRNMRAFLYRCARNIAIDTARQLRTQSDLKADVELQDLQQEAVNDDIERVLSGRQRLEIVEQVIRQMEPKRRTVLVMRAIHELNYSEIARRTKLSRTRVMQLAKSAILECERALQAADCDREQ